MKMDDDSADDEDSGADEDAEDNALDPDDLKDAADPDGNQLKPKQTRKVMATDCPHAADVYVQSSPRHRAHRPHLKPTTPRGSTTPSATATPPVTTTW